MFHQYYEYYIRSHLPPQGYYAVNDLCHVLTFVEVHCLEQISFWDAIILTRTQVVANVLHLGQDRFETQSRE